jgi:hypothetical protein
MAHCVGFSLSQIQQAHRNQEIRLQDKKQHEAINKTEELLERSETIAPFHQDREAI